MAHAAGNPDSGGIPEIMRKYRSGGTPWVVIIDPAGRVVYNDFHIKVDHAVLLIRQAGNDARLGLKKKTRKNNEDT
jgi:hypothetical protein